MWIFGLLVACGGPADKAGGSDDTDRRPEETDPGPVDTDGPDTPPVDTDVPYVEPGDDSDTQRETVDLPPPDLGAGFVDLTAALYATWSRDVFPGDRIDVHEPDLTHASFVDLDGDGWSEVVVFGTGAAPDAPRLPQALRYDRVAEALVFDPALTASVIGLDPQTAGFADLDGDGDADAIPGGWEDDPIEALGDGTFARDPSRRWPAYGPGLMSAAIVDLDADGSPDIVRSATGCRPDAVSWEAMVRVGAFRWRLHTGLLAAAPPANPYAMGAGWLGGQLVLMGLGLACSQADEAPGFFITTREDAEGYPVFEGTDITPQGGPYKLRVQVAGGPVTRVNPMGASLGDLDGDGDVDLVITSVHRDLLVFLDDGSLPLRDVTGAPPAELPPKLPDASGGPYEALKPWGVATLDVDRDGVNDLVFVNGDDHSDWIQDTPGGHRPAVMINRRSAWVEAGEAAHLGLPWNGRSTAVGDLDHDGLPDLAFGGNGEPPRVYLNRASGERPGLALRLRGTTSGGPASGAVARVFDDGLATDAVVAGGIASAGTVSEPIVFLTTGADGVADRVEIRWPSGLVQELVEVEAGYHEVVEPETVAVSAVSAPADGLSRVTVRFTPRAADGGVGVAGAVDITRVGGAGEPAGPVERVGDRWERSFVAPEAPGWLRVEVVVDGRPQVIRPRVTWEAR